MLYACGLPGLVPYQYAARSTQTRDFPCKRCRLEGGKARSKPRGTKPCSAEDVPVADYAHVRVAAASIRLRTQANPPRGASTQSVGMAQDRASARMTSAGRRRWLPFCLCGGLVARRGWERLAGDCNHATGPSESVRRYAVRRSSAQ
jgi:hypothetical protein